MTNTEIGELAVVVHNRLESRYREELDRLRDRVAQLEEFKQRVLSDLCVSSKYLIDLMDECRRQR